MAGNKLPVGSVIMCKLAAFVIMEDGDIDYIGGGKMEMVCQADDPYFKFLDQQVKKLHIERSQGFIRSIFLALTGSRCKTRRKQVRGIPPMPVTIGSHTPSTSVDAPANKTLSEDVTKAELVAKMPAPVSPNEEPVQSSSKNNQLGESYIADNQYNGKHIPFHCTNVDEHEHLTNHFNECLVILVIKLLTVFRKHTQKLACITR